MRTSCLLSAIVVLLAGSAQAGTTTTPQAAHPTLTPSSHGINGNIEHGRYIVHDVAMCVQCHAPRDDKGDIVESREFEGAPIPFTPPWPTTGRSVAADSS